MGSQILGQGQSKIVGTIQHPQSHMVHQPPISQSIIRQPMVQTIKREELEYVDCKDPNCNNCQVHQPQVMVNTQGGRTM